jgi:hypothetical protein
MYLVLSAFTPAAVYEKIMFRKAIKNFEMTETFVELEMYFEIT